MAKRVPRQHVPTRTAPTAPAPGRTPGHQAGGSRRRRGRGTPTRHPDRRRGGARRRARGGDRRRGEGRRGGQASGRPRHGPPTPSRPAPASSLAVSAAEEYAYVARDVRRIAIVGGVLILVLLVLWLVVHLTGFSVL